MGMVPLDKYGHGAGGTRRKWGYAPCTENRLVFTSCYVANDATLSTLGSKLPGCVIAEFWLSIFQNKCTVRLASGNAHNLCQQRRGTWHRL